MNSREKDLAWRKYPTFYHNKLTNEFQKTRPPTKHRPIPLFQQKLGKYTIVGTDNDAFYYFDGVTSSWELPKELDELLSQLSEVERLKIFGREQLESKQVYGECEEDEREEDDDEEKSEKELYVQADNTELSAEELEALKVEYRNSLKNRNISQFSLFTLSNINLSEKLQKQIFEEYCETLAEEKQKTTLKLLQLNQQTFKDILANLTTDSKWIDYVPHVKQLGLVKEECRKQFLERVKELKIRSQNEKDEEEKKLFSGFSELMDQIGGKEKTWEQVKAECRDDPLFKAVHWKQAQDWHKILRN